MADNTDLTNPSPTGSQQSGYDRRVFGGRPHDITGVDANGQYVWSNGSAEDEVNRYRGLGAAAANRAAYQNNWAQSNQARGYEGDAMGLMRNAAAGRAPSQAQLLGQNMIDQSLQAQMAGAASARGGSLAQAAAMRQASNGAAAFQQQGMNNLSALRAQEMAQARGDYFGAAQGIRGQDIGQQSLNMQSELAQRQMNQQAQQWYEGRGYDVNAAEQQAGLQQQALDAGNYQFAQGMEQHQRDRRDDMIGAGLAGGATVGSALITHSDIRTKTGMRAPSGCMYSDDRTKLAAAWDQGHSAAIADVEKLSRKSPAELAAMSEGKGYVPAAAAVRNLKASAFDEGSNVGARNEMLARIAAQRGQPLPVPPMPPPQAAPPPPAQAAPATVAQLPPPAPPPPPVMGSDERTKVIDLDTEQPSVSGVIDLDARDEGDIDRPQFDQRPQFQPPTFKRDTPAMQRAVKRGYEDKAGRDADAMMASYAKALEQGPATQEAMARANRSMEGASYAYKPEFTPPTQAPGEQNVGPIAQNMAADPVAATAVKKDPNGLLVLDQEKMTKLNSAGIASLQKQIDTLASLVAKKGRAR